MTDKRIRKILSAVGEYHLEIAERERISLKNQYVKPRYLNVIRENSEIPRPLKTKAEKVAAQTEIAQTLSAPNTIDDLLAKIRQIMPDEKFDSEESVLELITIIYSALSGLCQRKSGAITDACRIFSRNNRELADYLREQVAKK